MKLKQLSLTLAATLALGLAGCGKNESATTIAQETATRTAETAKVEAANAAETAKAEAAKAEAAKVEAAKAEAARVEAAKVEVAKVEAARIESARVEAAKVEAAKVEAAKVANSAKTKELIDRASSLVADGKLSDASGVLQQLAGQPLSADQTKRVDALKEQVRQALIAKAATDAAGNLLKQ